MKKLLIYFLSVMLIVCSCAKINDITLRDNPRDLTEIVFNASNPNVVTKAIVESTAMQDEFGVYGYVVPSASVEEGNYIMKNGHYDKEGTAHGDAHYYWPKFSENGINYRFTAYSKFDESVSYNGENGNVTITVPTLTQNLINNPADFDDILWAQKETEFTENSIPLNFKHALSWLQFNAEVADNAAIKEVTIQSVRFSKYQPYQAYQPAVEPTEYQPAVPAQYDTTDVWFNLKRSSNVDGSPSRTATKTGDTWGSYVDNFEIPAALVAEIKSYYSINNGTAGNYNLKMGASDWPSAEIRQLRIVKDIPDDYKLPVKLTNGPTVVFFNALKYLEDNGYKMAPRNSGGKPAIFDYPIIDLFVNGTNANAPFTIVGLNYSASTVYDASVAGNIPTYNCTVELVQEAQPEVPANPGSPEVPEMEEGYYDIPIFTEGTITVPTREIVDNITLVKGAATDSFEFAPAKPVLTQDNKFSLLSNAIVFPQDVPEYVTLIFDLTIVNGTEEVTYSNILVSRQINTGKDMSETDYVSAWQSAHKYIYNFKISIDEITFTPSVIPWNSTDTEYHVWNY